jgi:fluoroquinolone transport system permease protein
MRFQFQYGFYFIYAVFCVLYAFLLFILPESWRENTASIMIYSDPAAMGLFFMGAIVLLEKSERVLNAIAVSPVKVSEYVAAKVISLMLISVIISLILAIAAKLTNITVVMLATALTSVVFTLLGIIAATRINSLNRYVLVTVPIEVVCFIPPLVYLFTPKGYMRWFPLNGSIALIAGRSQNIPIDLLMLLIAIVCLWSLAISATDKMWKRLGGVKL